MATLMGWGPWPVEGGGTGGQTGKLYANNAIMTFCMSLPYGRVCISCMRILYMCV